ncbi:MAG: hypothetical protein JJ896_15850 [Rhodothermales bacterium]|nr:hypothetical protein [Rhodothermales bacterium]MBO6781129.1 hypothetical protein [Rhodothermales bacterium]
MTAANRINWKPIFLEAMFVVFGVFVALFANDWWAERRAVEEANGLLGTIESEILDNHALVSQSALYHMELSGRLYAAMGAGERLSPRDFERGFMSLNEPLAAAWSTAVEADAVPNMPVVVVLSLSRTYQEQERYRTQRAMLAELIYQGMYDGGLQALPSRPGSHATLLSSSIFLECGLLDLYQSSLQVLGREAPPQMPQGCRDILNGAGR